MSLCKYRSILGNPGQGVHSFRIFNVAVVDVVLTVLAAVLISRRHFWKVLLALFVAGIVAHRVFCVRTTVDRLLFKE